MSAQGSLPQLNRAAGPGPSPVQAGGRTAATALWQWMAHPLAVLAPAVVLLLLLLVSLLVPQLPSQLRNEPGAASRWLIESAGELGAAGTFLRTAGFLDILHSGLTQSVLALLAFSLLVQVADRVAHARFYQKLPALLDQPAAGGEPLALASTTTILRRRQSVGEELAAVTENWRRRLASEDVLHGGVTARRTVRATLRLAEGEHSGAPAELEERFLWRRAAAAVWLQPLLPLGMLVAIVSVVLLLRLGWELRIDALIPGGRAADPNYGVTVEYLAGKEGQLLRPGLQLTNGGESVWLPLSAEMSAALDGVELRAAPGQPALLVQSVDGSPILARPGQANPVAAIGLEFPSPEREETLLMTWLGAGLRIVRDGHGTPDAGDDSFVVEVYRSGDTTPIQRDEITESSLITVRSASGDVVLALVPLPSLMVQIRSLPSTGWMWVGLALALVGATGYRTRPAFLLVQLGAWPIGRTVLVAQSDAPEVLARLIPESPPDQSDEHSATAVDEQLQDEPKRNE